MSAKPKKIAYKIITMGRWKGSQCTVTKKKPQSEGNIVVNIVDGPVVELHPSLIQ